MLTRRGVIGGLIALAAPAIVPVKALMPLRGTPLIIDPRAQYTLDRVAGLKASGLWDKLDALYVFSVPDEETALTNIKALYD